ncbi:MAG: hypothetical protein WC975_15855 [Phycisphaerae bacterium]
MSVTTQVKIFSPEIFHFAYGQEFHVREASNEALAIGESVDTCPGSKSMTGYRTVHIGTWENRSVPKGSRQGAEKATRRYGVSVVGPANSRGVAGVMPGGA